MATASTATATTPMGTTIKGKLRHRIEMVLFYRPAAIPGLTRSSRSHSSVTCATCRAGAALSYLQCTEIPAYTAQPSAQVWRDRIL